MNTSFLSHSYGYGPANPGSAAKHPGVYCLRTMRVEQDNATLWRSDAMLGNLESVFRSVKTDLGFRPAI